MVLHAEQLLVLLARQHALTSFNVDLLRQVLSVLPLIMCHRLNELLLRLMLVEWI